METIDCRGLNCPEPVLKAKAALERGGDDLLILVDNQASADNVQRFGRSRGCEVSLARRGADYEIRLQARESGAAEQDFDPHDYPCPLPGEEKVVYVLGADSMGRGSDELGWALLQTYVTTIGRLSPLPWRILCYNGGVKVVATPGKALEALQELEQQGVEILSCGTCLEFFHLEDALQVGRITNMYEIMESMTQADRLVSPY